jgi:prepilin-type processing-associated H-X9-DG protein
MTATPALDQAIFLKITDAAAFNITLQKAKAYLENVAALKVESIPFGQRQFQYVALGQLLPAPVDFGVAYTVEGEHLILAFNPTTMKNTLSWIDQPGKNILESEDFKTVMAHLPSAYAGVSYVNLKELAGFLYSNVLPIATMAMAVSGAPPLFDTSKLPPVDVVTKHLFGLGSTTQSDETGFSVQVYSPVGLITALGIAGAGFGMASALRAGEGEGISSVPPEEQCTNNIRQLGIGALLYAYDHNGAFPSTFEEMATYYNNDQSLLQCPAVQEHETPSDYELVPGLTLESGSDKVLIHEKKPNHEGKLNVVFTDGRVEGVTPEDLDKLLTMPGSTPKQVS